MKIVQIDMNWADEMDISSVGLYSDKQVEEFLAAVKEFFKNHTYLTLYVGTNEDIDFNSEEDLMACISTFSVAEEDEKVLDKYKHVLSTKCITIWDIREQMGWADE